MTGEQANKKGLVYIVEDEALLLELAEVILLQEGFATKIFLSAEQMLDELRSSGDQPQLLITDFVLGGLDGIELIAESKKLVPGLKTILLSGTVDESFVEQQKIKPDRFLPKPYNVQNLIDTVHSILR